MIKPSLEEARQLGKDHTIIPIALEIFFRCSNLNRSAENDQQTIRPLLPTGECGE
ncbi:hypothetical protein [Aerococcus urinaeequi]|uniref:hypothetical protein n=1 Tax=Aerococcus urinaeequi TaxID=51665 RepID=UPI003D6B840F